MGWLGKLFGGGGGGLEVTLPPVRIVPGALQLVDLRAMTDVDEALGAGVRVGVEMCVTLKDAQQRAFAFAPAVARALVESEGARLQAIAKALRTKLPLPEKRTDSAPQIRKGEVGLILPPAELDAARAACAAADTLAIADDGRLGAPDATRHRIRVPETRPEILRVAEQPVGLVAGDELVLDLRRVGRNTWVAFAAVEKLLVSLPAPRRRIWIVPTWAENVDGATVTARQVLAKNPPAGGDHIAFDAEPPPALLRWTRVLGVPVTNELANGVRLSYPELAQNVLLQHALS